MSGAHESSGGGESGAGRGPRGARGARLRGDHPRGVRPESRPTLRVFATTLWEFPSQHYTHTSPPGKGLRTMQGHKDYVGATPSWVIWQLLQRYTRENDVVVDPMCGSGTTLDVCEDTGRKGVGFDLAPSRPDIRQADARRIPVPDASADFVFIDPPYSTHVDYSDDPRCIGKLDSGGEDDGAAYYKAMSQVIGEISRVLKDRRYMALYVSDSFRKKKGVAGAGVGGGQFMPIGFELFAIMRRHFVPVDIIAVVRHNQKLTKGNWRKAAEEGNFFLRGFNYLFIMKKDSRRTPDERRS
ncbi:MAG TPA: DNA methyltransferase [Phycisphaerales bacterium]|nr:DNA methyltransferase [Phycisphaerales bacterium]